MSLFGVRLLGVSDFKAGVDKVISEVQRANERIVVESAALVEANAKANFEGSHKKGQPHEGGDLPNIVTGTLRRSIRHLPVRREGVSGASTTVGPSVVYARRVELGYLGSKGYPYFTPAVEKARPKFDEIARRNWTKATRR